MIRVLLWDVDNTLLDFPAAERRALQETFAQFRLGPCPEDRVERYAALNASYWRRLERGEITKAQLLPGRFQEFFQREGIACTDYDQVNAAYQCHLGDTVVFLDQSYDLVRDLRFLKDFQPHMVGIGPFLSQKDTPFRDFPNGSGELTLFLLSVIRLLLPEVLLPATTALGTLLPGGREQGILHGANVVMPNLSPQDAREKYTLYDNKLHSGAEAAESLGLLRESLSKIGYEIPIDKGSGP